MAEEQPKNKYEIAIYLSNLATIAMYLDKTGVEYHPMKEHLSQQFMAEMERMADAIEGEQQRG